MSQSKRKSQARRRTNFTGEKYQQAQQRLIDIEDGLPLIPDTGDSSQRAVEAAVMHRLLSGARARPAAKSGSTFPLLVQAVSPTAMGLWLEVPIDDVESFTAALTGQEWGDGPVAADALMVRRQNRGVAVTVDGTAHASVQMLCSWDRLLLASETAEHVRKLSASAVQVEAAEPAPLTIEHRAVLSGLLRRVALFNAPQSLDWLYAWHKWLTTGSVGGKPQLPAGLASDLASEGFGLSLELLSVLEIQSAMQLSTTDPVHPARPRRPMLTPPPEWTFDRIESVLPAMTAQELLAAARSNLLVSQLATANPVMMESLAEFARGLALLAEDMILANRGTVRIIIGYRLPFTSRRMDALIVGVHPATERASYVLVSLKPWGAVREYQDSHQLVDAGYRDGPRLHPVLQADGHAAYLASFLRPEGAGALSSVVYMYNAYEADVAPLRRRLADTHSPLFTKQERRTFREFVRTIVADVDLGEGAEYLPLRQGSLNRNLVSGAIAELDHGPAVTLLDEQRIAHELVLSAVEGAVRRDQKTVVIVTGGPGAGKSAIAFHLMGELARRGRRVVHATGSKSFTQTLRRYAGRGSTRLRNLFLYFNSFMAAEPNGLDVLICDEAHRIRDTSVHRFTRAAERRGARAQVEELIAAARVPVFFLDEDQAVRPGEKGSVEYITAAAKRAGLPVQLVSLSGQFGSGGSRAYQQWVSKLLDPASAEAPVWHGDSRFEVRLAKSPEELEEFLAAKLATGESARLAAGYCWPWSDPRPDGSLVPDVQIGVWSRPWQAKSDSGVGDAPGSPYWATDPNGFGQIGSVYAAQGFDYEWAGVIIGPDLVARDGRLVARRDASKDPIFRSRRQADDAQAERHIRSTYRVLLTRGTRGVVIFATDAETRAYLGHAIQPVTEPPLESGVPLDEDPQSP